MSLSPKTGEKKKEKKMVNYTAKSRRRNQANRNAAVSRTRKNSVHRLMKLDKFPNANIIPTTLWQLSESKRKKFENLMEDCPLHMHFYMDQAPSELNATWDKVRLQKELTEHQKRIFDIADAWARLMQKDFGENGCDSDSESVEIAVKHWNSLQEVFEATDVDQIECIQLLEKYWYYGNYLVYWMRRE